LRLASIRLLAVSAGRQPSIFGRPFLCLLRLLGVLIVTTPCVAPAQAADLFVSSHDTAAVVRFDGKTGKLIGNFVAPGSGGLSGTHGLAFGPDGNLYVNSRYGNSVLRYDGRTGAFIDAFVPAGTGGLDTNIGLVFGPDGNLYVTCYYRNTVLRFDGTTGAFIDTFVPAGSGGLNNPGGLAFGPGGNLYVASENGNAVLAYDGKTGAFLRTFVAPGSGGLKTPIGLVFGPDGNLYVGGAQSNNVLRYDGKTGAFIDAFIPAGSGGLGGTAGLKFGPDSNLYVASDLTQNVLRYDGQTGTFLGVFASEDLKLPSWLTFSPPEGPSGLVALGSGSQVRLSWIDNSDDEIGFEIQRKTGEGPFVLIATAGANATAAADTTATPATSLSYRVRAIGPTGPSVWSNVAAVVLSNGGKLQVRSTLTLPLTCVGGTSAQTLFLRNIGATPLVGSVASLSPPFEVLSGSGHFMLPPGEALPVVIGFSPVASGMVISTLVINSTDPSQPAVYARIEGEGTTQGDACATTP
jgi:DNA-binding beta-propeller fold protein YncE